MVATQQVRLAPQQELHLAASRRPRQAQQVAVTAPEQLRSREMKLEGSFPAPAEKGSFRPLCFRNVLDNVGEPGVLRKQISKPNVSQRQMCKPGSLRRQMTQPAAMLRQMSQSWCQSSTRPSSSTSKSASKSRELFSGSFSKEEHARNTECVRRQLRSMQRRTIKPNGRFLRIWDRMMVLTLIWVATLTPFEVSFVPSHTPNWTLFVINRMVDCLFLVDIVLSFCIPFRKSPKEGGRWVYSSRAIARNYLKSWFLLDAITAVPVDVIVLALELDPSSLLAKAGRALRLLKLARLVRLGRIVKRWLARSTIDLSVLELLKFVLMTVLMAHWLACLWGFEGNNFSSNEPIDVDTWYVESYRKLSWVQKHQLTDAQPMELCASAGCGTRNPYLCPAPLTVHLRSLVGADGVSLYVALANIFGGR